MSEKFLYQKLIEEFGKQPISKIEIPNSIVQNINPKFEIRPYQKAAFQNFLCYFEEDFYFKADKIYLLFNMATGSGKTLMMAGLILFLYEKGYSNFLFFVDSTNIIEKTKDNFLNKNSSKYLFNERIFFNGKEIFINEVKNFGESKQDEINICFTTIQKLHVDLNSVKENSITLEDFEENKIVLLSDEAHHINAETSRNNSSSQSFISWEEIVKKIFNCHAENILLEFTATIDLKNEKIQKKYLNKILFQYDLIHFRKDKYSKEIKTVAIDSDFEEVILRAILLSQYRLKIAEKNNIFLKPVLLFKAQKTIEQSKKNEENFKKIIEDLNEEQIQKILNSSQKQKKKKENIFNKTFDFFQETYHKNYQNFILEIQNDFGDEKIINVNDEDSKNKNQLLLNSLEDKNNLIRAIFAVNKLNEGWDVLNLFDIVRLYDSRDGNWQTNGKYKAGKTTLSEAQLIGRGARYYPFHKNREENFYQRKYDKDSNNELKILEELHYHSKYNSHYLEELERALIEQGLKDEKNSVEKKQVKIIDENFYHNKIVFKNKQIPNENKNKNSFHDYGIEDSYSFSLTSGEVEEKNFLSKQEQKNNFEGNQENNQQQNEKSKISNQNFRIDLKKIDSIIFYKAFNQNSDFWTFANCKKYFGNLESMEDFLAYNFLYKISIETNKEQEELSRQEQLQLVNNLLKTLAKIIVKNVSFQKGSKIFYQYPVKKIFKKVKELKFDKDNSQFTEISTREIKDFFVHDRLYGTSEEKNFIIFFQNYLEELNKKYSQIKLLRNNRELKLYRFEDGEAFEPDFILFLTEKNGKEISYQVFIEPKGNHLLEKDKKKEEFLKQIKGKFLLEKLITDKNYQLLGLKFYNKSKQSEFEKDFEEELL